MNEFLLFISIFSLKKNYYLLIYAKRHIESPHYIKQFLYFSSFSAIRMRNLVIDAERRLACKEPKEQWNL